MKRHTDPMGTPPRPCAPMATREGEGAGGRQQYHPLVERDTGGCAPACVREAAHARTVTHAHTRTHTMQIQGPEQHQTEQNICRTEGGFWQLCPDTQGDKPKPSHAGGKQAPLTPSTGTPVTPLPSLLHLESTVSRHSPCSRFCAFQTNQ